MAELELTQADFKAAFDGCPGPARGAGSAARRVRSYHEAQKKSLRRELDLPRRRRHAAGPEGDAAGPRGHLRARRQGGLPVQPDHERGAGACGRGGEIIMVVPTPVRGSVATGGSGAMAPPHAATQRTGAGRRLRGRRDPRLHHRRCAGRGRAGLRHGHGAQGGQDHRPRQRLCGQRQEARVRHRRHRHDRRSVSEILVLADGSTPADWVAMDLFSQAEHDELAQSILLCPDAAYIDAVQAAIDRLLPAMPRRPSSPSRSTTAAR
jgi:histidinol dehydrogenase